MVDFDSGPPVALAEHFAAVPAPPVAEDFWFDWGPVFYRGRLDGSARVLCLASDPGPTERIAGRTLVGNAGQRVQGFLAKLGLTHSYVCVNAWAYALHPGRASAERDHLEDPEQRTWRNALYDQVVGPELQAIVAFGGMAQEALHQWDGRPDVPVQEIPHPSSRDETVLLDAWRVAIVALRPVVTPDGDGDPTLPNYGTAFTEADHEEIPRRDLPFGAAPFLGDDAWARLDGGRNTVKRPSPDDGHTLIWRAPGG